MVIASAASSAVVTSLTTRGAGACRPRHSATCSSSSDRGGVAVKLWEDTMKRVPGPTSPKSVQEVEGEGWRGGRERGSVGQTQSGPGTRALLPVMKVHGCADEVL